MTDICLSFSHKTGVVMIVTSLRFLAVPFPGKEKMGDLIMMRTIGNCHSLAYFTLFHGPGDSSLNCQEPWDDGHDSVDQSEQSWPIRLEWIKSIMMRGIITCLQLTILSLEHPVLALCILFGDRDPWLNPLDSHLLFWYSSRGKKMGVRNMRTRQGNLMTQSCYGNISTFSWGEKTWIDYLDYNSNYLANYPVRAGNQELQFCSIID